MEVVDPREYAGRYNRMVRFILRACIDDWNKNIVISPLSILLMMALIADSTSGETRKEIQSKIGGMEAPLYINQLRRILSFDRSLAIANAVCVRKDIGPKISKLFKDAILPEYGAEIFSSEDVVSDVNLWVKQKTNGLIPEAAPESVRDVLMALISAVAFDAKWSDPYMDDQVQDRKFFNLDGTVSRVMMLHGSEWTFLENDDFIGFEKDYEGSRLKFAALLPKEEGAAELAEAVERLDFSSLRRSRALIHTRVPEFRIDFRKNLTRICKDFGIRRVFTDDAEFGPATDEKLMLDSVIHQAMIEVNQSGTRAAAVTLSYAVGCCPPREIRNVFLDRSFIFGLVDSELGIPAFTGVVTHLENAKEDPDRIKRRLERARKLRNEVF